MAWIGRFDKFLGRDAASNIGTAHADWEEAGEVVYTYSQAVDGVSDAAEFKANAIAGRDEFLARRTKNENISNQLTTFLNQ